MKQADLYVRVSTDEQADKGYSIRSQEEVLRKYCSIQQITVINVIYEDYSAKTFNRPAWSKMLAAYKKEKRRTADLLLFTKWDRFSRNAGDAYQMINVLRKVGIEPQAVEQPLDLSIPENKMMLAFYLAAPEVENDRRALNTFYGMRRARKEGRYLTTAPYGYVNRTLDGKKSIIPREPQASIVKWAFEEMAKGIHHVDSIRQKLVSEDFQCSKSHFYHLLRNYTYCGKIVVPAYRDEPRRLVDGQHEAIISERLFQQVQDVLDGRQRIQLVKMTTVDSLPLRGFLICPSCGKLLTGSGSKGRNNYYYYYHCESSCGVRYKAQDVNSSFVTELQRYVPRQGVAEVFRLVVKDLFTQQNGSQSGERKELLAKIQLENDRLTKARRLLLDDAIDTVDYKSIKDECERKLLTLESKLTDFSKPAYDLEECLDKALIALKSLQVRYLEGDTSKKRQLIGSMYPEKLCFDGNEYRTAKVNEAARLIYLINSKLDETKKRTKLDFSSLSASVAGTGLEPMTFGL
ncbi:recombinase family protein [Mucilaginibacter defluvii]|uniref:Recombinase family protein n=1 Tax=Mucilaginibacter defluvii TaxID=1196019 RepID=A0ABP9G0C5_9SPHI